MGRQEEQVLIAERDRHSAWLQSQPGFTGSYLGKDTAGNSQLVLQFDPGTPVTPEVRERIAEKFAGLRVRIDENVPRARAH